MNHFANIRLISAKDNNWKRDQDPKRNFEKWPQVMGYYLIPKGLLDNEQSPGFLEKGRDLILEKVQTFLGLSQDQVAAQASQLPRQTAESTASQPPTQVKALKKSTKKR